MFDLWLLVVECTGRKGAVRVWVSGEPLIGERTGASVSATV